MLLAYEGEGRDSEAAEVSVVCGCVAEHSISLRDEIATEHSESTVISTPVTMIEGRGREGRGREGKGEFLVYSHTCTFFTYVHVQVHLYTCTCTWMLLITDEFR